MTRRHPSVVPDNPAGTPDVAAGARPSHPAMCLFIFGTWALAAWWFDRRFWDVITQTPDLGGRAALLLLAACLNFFWLMASYHAALMLFTLIVRRRTRRRTPAAAPEPSVALLYTTMHDFQEGAALSCVMQD